jgi:hypothetical protein
MFVDIIELEDASSSEKPMFYMELKNSIKLYVLCKDAEEKQDWFGKVKELWGSVRSSFFMDVDE